MGTHTARHGGYRGDRGQCRGTDGNRPAAHPEPGRLTAYSFTGGADPTTGQLDAGLFFICFNRDPDRQFHADPGPARPQNDAMNKYVKHAGSGIFAVPPSVREVGDWFGKKLFE